MAKGKTNQPLVIAVWEKWATHPEITAAVLAGHSVYVYGHESGVVPDLILHPAAHIWDDAFWGDDTEEPKRKSYLPAAFAAARARKRKKK